MAEETLLTAARRMVRDMNIDLQSHGGIIRQVTQESLHTLDKQVRLASEREKVNVNTCSTND